MAARRRVFEAPLLTSPHGAVDRLQGLVGNPKR